MRAVAVEEQLSSRLPRPRPDEPRFTGSVASAKLRVAPTSRETPVAAGALQLAELKDKAALTARTWSECGEAVASEVLESRDGPASRVVIRIDCRNGTRFYIDQDETTFDRFPPEEPVAAAITDGEAIGACEEKLKHGLAMPASYQRRLPSTGVYRGQSGDAVVTFDFDTLNGLGFPLAMQAECLLDARQIARLEVHPK